MDNNKKKCHICKEELDISKFSKSTKCKGVQYYDATCKVCNRKIRDTIDTDTKIICLTCNEEKPASEYKKIKVRNAKVTYDKSCNNCNLITTDNSTKSTETKICNKCEKEKCVSEFRKTGVRNSEQCYLGKCKECIRGTLIVKVEANAEIPEKKCTKCEQIKLITDFHIGGQVEGKQIHRSQCKDCVKIESKYRNKKVRNHLLELKQKAGCQICGEPDPRKLEFDHNQGIKNNNMANIKNIKQIDEEAKLTIVLCCNCHAVKTYHEREAKRKPESELSKNSELISRRKQARENKAYIDKLREAGCSACGFKSDCPSVIEFDHIDRTKKSKCISQMLDYNLDTIKKEIEKTRLLCRNCHRIKIIENQDYLPIKMLLSSNGKEQI